MNGRAGAMVLRGQHTASERKEGGAYRVDGYSRVREFESASLQRHPHPPPRPAESEKARARPSWIEAIRRWCCRHHCRIRTRYACASRLASLEHASGRGSASGWATNNPMKKGD